MVHTWEAESDGGPCRPEVPGTQSVARKHTYLEEGRGVRAALFIDILSQLHVSYWKEICYRNRQGAGRDGGFCFECGVQLLRLKGREKDASGSRTEMDMGRHIAKCPSSFLFQKQTSFETELPYEARQCKENNF